MQRNYYIFGSLLFLPAVLSSAQEHKLERSALPAAVAATFDREANGATVKGYATEREHGQQVYEAETILNGHTRDLQVAPDGTLNEIEEEVPLSSLPEQVQTSLKTRAKGAQIAKVESLTKHGRLVAFEATIQRGSKHSEVQVGPNGEKLTREE